MRGEDMPSMLHPTSPVLLQNKMDYDSSPSGKEKKTRNSSGDGIHTSQSGCVLMLKAQ